MANPVNNRNQFLQYPLLGQGLLIYFALSLLGQVPTKCDLARRELSEILARRNLKIEDVPPENMVPLCAEILSGQPWNNPNMELSDALGQLVVESSMRCATLRDQVDVCDAIKADKRARLQEKLSQNKAERRRFNKNH